MKMIVCAAALVTSCLITTTPALAAIINWNGGIGNWDVGANWSSGVEPASPNDAYIDNGTVTINTVGNTIRILRVGNTAISTLIINGGGTLTHSGASFVGALAGSNGTVNVADAGSVWNWTNAGTLQIGSLGTGEVNIINGGQLGNALGTLVVGGGNTGELNVDGNNSLVSVSTFRVGQSGQGTLNITNGGRVISGTTTIGFSASSFTSTATVDGAGSSWTTAALAVGSASNAQLFVTDGALLNTVGGTIGGATGAGFVEIDNSTWDASNIAGTAQISVGAGGVGALNILNGSAVTVSNRLNVGPSNGNGVMLIDNSSFTLLPQTVGVQANSTEIGRDGGTGILTIQNGSTVMLNSLLQVATRNPNSVGSMIVQGAGTTLTANNLIVGQQGKGDFQLLDGAVLNTGNFTSGGISGNTLIDNATWNITSSDLVTSMRLGTSGISTLNLQNGAVVNVTGGLGGEVMEIALNPAATGILTIGGTGATLNAAQVIGGSRATVNFDHTNLGQVFAPQLRGFMTVNQMNTGTTILGGDGDYIGATNVIDGILQAGVVNAFSQNSAYHMNGGLLVLDGFDNEIGSLDGSTNVMLGAGTLTTGSLESTQYDGLISGTGGLTKTGNTIFVINNAQPYTGATLVERGSLHAGVQDVIAVSSSLTVNEGGIFNMGRFNQTINGNVANNGLISFGGLGNELTISGNLSGNGVFFMETQMDELIGDHITVAGTSAGSFELIILDRGGTPADPLAVLELIDSTDGVARFAAVGGTVDVGVYAYEVVRGDTIGEDPTNWYLANTIIPSEAARAVINTAAGLSTSWFTQLDNLHRRMGRQRLVDPSVHPYDLWGRGYSRRIDVGASVSGRPFEENITGFDLGVDRVIVANSSGNTWLLGLFGGYGTADRTFNNFGSEGHSHVPSGGLYATWFNTSNYYVDITAKVARFNNSFDALDGSGNLHHGKYSNWGYGAGVEAGKQFDVGSRGIIEPQVQLYYVYLTGNEYVTKRNMHVNVKADNIGLVRVGLEAGRTFPIGSGMLYPYARASFVEQFSTGSIITADAFSFNSNFDGANIEYGAGIIYQVNDQLQGYFYTVFSNGQVYDTPWGIGGGARYEF